MFVRHAPKCRIIESAFISENNFKPQYNVVPDTEKACWAIWYLSSRVTELKSCPQSSKQVAVAEAAH